MRSILTVARFLFRVVLYVVPVVLLLMIGWTAIQAIGSYSSQQTRRQVLQDRQDDYMLTATAMTSDDSASAQRVQLVQQVFATNTPDASAVEDDPEPSITPIPPQPPATVDAPAESTPFELPEFYFPREPEAGLVLEGTAVPTQVPTVPREYELVNIVLLGADEELTTDSFLRTDTMIVVSINTETGSVAMLSLPRDMFVYIPSGIMGRLNLAYGIGENIGWQPSGGFGLLRETIFYNFGINVHYYARVNFSQFETIIDTLGGVDIGVDCAYQDYYPVDDFDINKPVEENYYLRTLDIGYYTFNGFDALWYARTRKISDDFDRGRRQQQLLRAIWRKARDNGLITNLPSLWGDLTDVVETNIPFDTMLGLLPYAVNLDISNIENFNLVRTYHTTPWQPPSGDYVQLPVYEPIATMMRDFYTPPTENQLSLTGPSIAVYNASGNENWDMVASERLRWEGLNAVALGESESGVLASSHVIDQLASDKGSIIPSINDALNLSLAQVEVQPNPNREYDYQVFIGQDYSSCTFGVLPIE
jgi:LCP family protein required for cell wall assembly